MAERKYFLTSFSKPSGTFADVQPFPLTLIGQNWNETSRIGDKITGTSLECLSYCFPRTDPQTSSPMFMYCRWIGFIWKQDTVPTIDHILDPNYSVTTSFLKPLQPYNHNSKISRKILWDKRWIGFHDFVEETNDYSAASNDAVKHFKFVVNLTKLKNKLNVVNYNPGSTVARNHIYTCYLTSSTADGASNNWYVQFKYSFVDM